MSLSLKKNANRDGPGTMMEQIHPWHSSMTRSQMNPSLFPSMQLTTSFCLSLQNRVMSVPPLKQIFLLFAADQKIFKWNSSQQKNKYNAPCLLYLESKKNSTLLFGALIGVFALNKQVYSRLPVILPAQL
jgi:hypothetical protein